MKKEITHIDLERGIFLQVGKSSAHPPSNFVDLLAAIASSFQNLVFALANYHEPNSYTRIAYLEIEMCGFAQAISAPQFRYARYSGAESFEKVASVRTYVGQQLAMLFKVAEAGAYADLESQFSTDIRRDEVVGHYYEFLSAPGEAQMTVIQAVDQGAIGPAFEFRQFDHEAFRRVMAKKEPNGSEDVEDHEIARISFPDWNKSEPMVHAVFSKKLHSIDYSPMEISASKAIYKLKFPLRCKIDDAGSGVLIESEILDIIGHGESLKAAQQDFAENFDYAYTRYNQLDDSKLVGRLKLIKNILNEIVTIVEQRDG